MAIAQSTAIDKFDVQYFDSVIESKGISVSLIISDNIYSSHVLPEDEIKRQLVHKLAEAILEKQLCEFTMIPNTVDYSKVFRVRAYLTPKEQCKILRQAVPNTIKKY